MPIRRLTLVALAASIVWLAAAPAFAGGACSVASPRFEPKLAKPMKPEAARFLGGAKLFRPVAAPCPAGPHARDV